MCCSVMVYSSVYSEWSFAGPCPRTWRGIKRLPNLRSGCIALQMSWSHSNQIPALAKSPSGPPSDPSCPHWQAVETQNPNDCPLSIDPQLLPSVSLVWSHLPAPLQMAGEPCWNQGRSVCTFLFFLATRDSLQERTGLGRKERCPFFVSTFLIDDLVYGCLLVPWSGDNVLVIHGYIAAQHRGRLFRLETKKREKISKTSTLL